MTDVTAAQYLRMSTRNTSNIRLRTSQPPFNDMPKRMDSQSFRVSSAAATGKRLQSRPHRAYAAASGAALAVRLSPSKRSNCAATPALLCRCSTSSVSSLTSSMPSACPPTASSSTVLNHGRSSCSAATGWPFQNLFCSVVLAANSG